MKEKARGRTAASEREVSSGRNPWVDFLTPMMGCEEKMLFAAVRSCRELGEGAYERVDAKVVPEAHF